jgi:glycosyltransferase involved in cell wall biosynthesis
VKFTLTVLGDGTDAEEFKREVAAEVPHGLIEIRPAVQPAEVYDVLAGHHLFLSTSECEGGPRTLVEAMSCHIVPIVTNIPGYSQEIVEDSVNGYQVAVGDVGAFVDRVILLDQDRPLLQRLSVGCRPAVAEPFSIDRMSRELDDFFRGLLAAPPRRMFDHKGEDLARILPERWPWMPPTVRRAARWAAWATGHLPGITP